MTKPLTPPDCDLRSVPSMLLDVQRFRDSDLVVMEKPEAVLAAILLWGASWHQVPAASLPDDDRMLAQLAGYGRSIPAWKKVRAGALRGFVKCSDGRLYHPVVAEKACDMWEDKLKRRHHTLLAAIRKHKERTGEQIEPPSYEQWLALGRPEKISDMLNSSREPSGNVTRDTINGHASVARETASNRTEQNVTEQNILTLETSSNEDSSVGTDPPLTKKEVLEAWESRMVPLGFPAVRKMTAQRERQLAARLKDSTLEEWQRAMDALERSAFCRGENDRGWRADFDFLLQPKSFTKLLEGAYDH